MNKIFNLNINFSILILIVLFFYKKKFNLIIKENYCFNYALFNFLKFKNKIYFLLYYTINEKFTLKEKIYIYIYIYFSCLYFYYTVNFIFFYTFLSTILCLFLLIFSLFNNLKAFIFKNLFKQENTSIKAVNFLNIQKKLNIKTRITLHKNYQNYNYHYIHFRYFVLPGSSFMTKLKEIGGSILTAAGLGGIFVFGTDVYKHQKDYNQREEIHTYQIRNDILNNIDKTRIEKNTQQDELSKLIDSSWILDSKREQIKTKKQQISESDKALEFWYEKAQKEGVEIPPISIPSKPFTPSDSLVPYNSSIPPISSVIEKIDVFLF